MPIASPPEPEVRLLPNRLTRRAAAVALAGYTLAILVVTLAPADPTRTAGLVACIICGERGLADVILNIILFTPVGFLGLVAFGRRTTIMLAAAALSATVELLQVGIPGRDASLGDLLFNTLGALAGYGLAASARAWIRPGPYLPRFAAAAALLPIAVVAIHAWLVRPSLPASDWYGMWSPRLAHLRPWDGTVLDARLDGTSIRHGLIPDPAPVRSALLRGDTLALRATAGSTTTGLGAIFAIYDGDQREIVLVGPDRRDLVLRTRLRAQDARLDQPDLRLRNALASHTPGDSLLIRARLAPADHCLEINGVGRCGLGHDAAHGWQLLLYPSHFPGWLRLLIATAWSATLVLPAGFFARTRPTLALGATAAATALIALPAIDPWLTLPPTLPLLGAAAAFTLAARLGRRLHTPPPHTPAP